MELTADSGGSAGAKVWDSDPVVLVLPKPAAGARLALGLRLSRDSLAPLNIAMPPSPFPPDRGHPGGALSASVMIAGEPFGRGEINVRVWRRRDGEWGGPEPAYLYLDFKGRAVIPNLQPGIYKLE